MSPISWRSRVADEASEIFLSIVPFQYTPMMPHPGHVWTSSASRFAVTSGTSSQAPAVTDALEVPR